MQNVSPRTLDMNRSPRQPTSPRGNTPHSSLSPRGASQGIKLTLQTQFGRQRSTTPTTEEEEDDERSNEDEDEKYGRAIPVPSPRHSHRTTVASFANSPTYYRRTGRTSPTSAVEWRVEHLSPGRNPPGRNSPGPYSPLSPTPGGGRSPPPLQLAGSNIVSQLTIGSRYSGESFC